MVSRPLTLRKTVVLVGMMGAGKTAIGRALATQLGVAFRDSDQVLEDAANMTIPEIFARDGEAFFREKEMQVIARLMDADPAVLSTGGGAFLDPRTRDVIADKGVAVWLDADLDILWERVRHKNTRPLLRTPNPRQTLSDLLDARRPVYAQADLRAEAQPHYSIDDMTAAVIDTLAARPDVLEDRP
ncbi:MAG: shikimate kinase [Pseudomonadota bacterium]